MPTVRELITRWGFEVDEAPLKKIDNGVKNITLSLGVMTAAFGAAGAAMGFFLNKAGEFEQTEIAFETMLGSVELAAKALQDIKTFTQTTPFELKDTLIGAKRLLAYNIEAEKLIPTLTSLGNIAAGVGRERLPFLILALGQVKTATKLRGQELRQFTEAGVPLISALAEQFGKKESEIFSMVSKGQVTFEDVEAAITKMTTGSGKFANLMQKQSKSFLGIWSNIKDTLNLLSIEIGQKLLPVGKKYLKLTLDWLKANSKLVASRMDKFFKKFTIALNGAVKIIKATVQTVRDLIDVFGGLEAITVFLGKAFLVTFGLATIGGIGQVVIGVFKLISAFKKLGVIGLLSNIKAFFIPILIGAAILALLAAFEDLFGFITKKKSLFEEFLINLGIPAKNIEKLRVSIIKLANSFKLLGGDLLDKVLEIFTGKSKKQGSDIEKNIERVERLADWINSLADALERVREFVTGDPVSIKTNLGNVDAISGAGAKNQFRGIGKGLGRGISKQEPNPSELFFVNSFKSLKFKINSFEKDIGNFFSFENFLKNSNIPSFSAQLFPPPNSKGEPKANQTNIEKIDINVNGVEDPEATADAVDEKFNEKLREADRVGVGNTAK